MRRAWHWWDRQTYGMQAALVCAVVFVLVLVFWGDFRDAFFNSMGL